MESPVVSARDLAAFAEAAVVFLLDGGGTDAATVEGCGPLAAEQTEFGPVAHVEADAVGPPGRRAFRLLIRREDAAAWLWVEREQLQALAMLIEQILTGLPALDLRAMQPPPQASRPRREAQAAMPPAVEFKVGQLALGYDEGQKLYLLLADEVESEDAASTRFSCQATRQQLRSLGESITPLLAAGRPRCPMCEAPLGTERHVCPRANGHAARAAED